jgi:hypothetical protein
VADGAVTAGAGAGRAARGPGRCDSASLSAIGSEIETVVPVPTRESTSR